MKKKQQTVAIVLTLAAVMAGSQAFCPAPAIQAKKSSTTQKKKISDKKLTLTAGQQKTLSLKPVTSKEKVKIVWKSSNKKIAAVSKKGVVKAKKKGNVRIMAKLNKKTYTCNVTVKSKSKAKKETITPDYTDGDIYYKTPSDYRLKKENVTYGNVEIKQYYSATTGKNRTCAVVLPPDYDKSKTYPVCYLLHGLGQDHTDWLNMNAPVILGNMIDAGTAKEMILVLPNCRARANDTYVGDAFSLSNYQAFDNFIHDLNDNLMPYIKENYAVKEGRENTAIAGFSMGGRTALYIGLSMQDTFGYIGGFCPAPGLFAYTANGVSENGLFTKETFQLNDPYKDNTLMMIVAAKNDTIVGAYPGTYHTALDSNGSKHIWYRKAGGHDANVAGNAFYNFARRIFA